MERNALAGQIGASFIVGAILYCLPRRRATSVALGATPTSGKKYYHLSTKKFDKFRQQYQRGARSSEPGFHFGTEETALIVADKLKKEGRVKKGENVYLYEVELNAKKPIRMAENRVGSWTVDRILTQIFEPESGNPADFVTEEMEDLWYEDIVELPNGDNLQDAIGDEDKVEQFTRWVKSQPFDSIVYDNEFEGGGESVIVFDPKQVVIKNVESIKV